MTGTPVARRRSLTSAGGGHAGADFLVEVVKAVAEFFEAGVDAAGSGVGVGDGGAAGDVEGEVRGGELDRAAVEEVAAASGQDAARTAEACGDILRGPFLFDFEAVHGGVAACGVGLHEEGGLALIAVAPGEAVGGEPSYGRSGSYEDALAVLGDGQALALEDGQGVADCHPGDAVVLDQLRLARQLVALGEPALVDGLAQLVGDLPEDRAVAHGVQRAEDAGGQSGHAYSFRYLDEWPTFVATVGSLATRRDHVRAD